MSWLHIPPESENTSPVLGQRPTPWIGSTMIPKTGLRGGVRRNASRGPVGAGPTIDLKDLARHGVKAGVPNRRMPF
jgi:hypothetical protein